MNFYIVTFDRLPNVSYRLFHDKFIKHPHFYRWWHYIQSSYIIGSDLSTNDISEHFTATAGSLGMRTTHLVLKVDLTKRQGMLPKDAWEWFKKNA
jgi:hypothetical protein